MKRAQDEGRANFNSILCTWNTEYNLLCITHGRQSSHNKQKKILSLQFQFQFNTTLARLNWFPSLCVHIFMFFCRFFHRLHYLLSDCSPTVLSLARIFSWILYVWQIHEENPAGEWKTFCVSSCHPPTSAQIVSRRIFWVTSVFFLIHFRSLRALLDPERTIVQNYRHVLLVRFVSHSLEIEWKLPFWVFMKLI